MIISGRLFILFFCSTILAVPLRTMASDVSRVSLTETKTKAAVANNSEPSNLRRRSQQQLSNGESEQTLDANLSPELRVVGGSDVAVGYQRYFVQWPDAQCGGTLIHRDLVLTAAHCYRPTMALQSENKVWIGSVFNRKGGVQRTIVEFFVHPRFDNTTYAYDFLIMRLNAPVNHILPVKLNSNINNPEDDDNLSVLGFGDLQEGSGMGSMQLQRAALHAIPHEVCNAQFDIVRSQFEGLGEVNDDLMICAAGDRRDSCQGDSGGPLLDRTKTQVGLVSWGIGCGRPSFSGIYARISTAYHWIRQQICAHSQRPPAEYCRQVTIQIDTDYYPSENSFALLDGNNDIIDEESNLAALVDASDTLVLNYSLPIQEDNTSYALVVYDKYSDGFCCNNGDGEIRIVVDSKPIIIESAKFSHQLRLEFDLNDKSNEEENHEQELYNSVAEGSKQPNNSNNHAETSLTSGQPETNNKATLFPSDSSKTEHQLGLGETLQGAGDITIALQTIAPAVATNQFSSVSSTTLSPQQGQNNDQLHISSSSSSSANSSQNNNNNLNDISSSSTSTFTATHDDHKDDSTMHDPYENYAGRYFNSEADDKTNTPPPNSFATYDRIDYSQDPPDTKDSTDTNPPLAAAMDGNHKDLHYDDPYDNYAERYFSTEKEVNINTNPPNPLASYERIDHSAQQANTNTSINTDDTEIEQSINDHHYGDKNLPGPTSAVPRPNHNDHHHLYKHDSTTGTSTTRHIMVAWVVASLIVILCIYKVCQTFFEKHYRSFINYPALTWITSVLQIGGQVVVDEENNNDENPIMSFPTNTASKKGKTIKAESYNHNTVDDLEEATTIIDIDSSVGSSSSTRSTNNKAPSKYCSTTETVEAVQSSLHESNNVIMTKDLPNKKKIDFEAVDDLDITMHNN